jgi:hypothetical protein
MRHVNALQQRSGCLSRHINKENVPINSTIRN